jgi:hypothetical protein
MLESDHNPRTDDLSVPISTPCSPTRMTVPIFAGALSPWTAVSLAQAAATLRADVAGFGPGKGGWRLLAYAPSFYGGNSFILW